MRIIENYIQLPDILHTDNLIQKRGLKVPLIKKILLWIKRFFRRDMVTTTINKEKRFDLFEIGNVIYCCVLPENIMLN